MLEGAGRPPIELQRKVMALCGVPKSDKGRLWHDRLPDRPTRPINVLVQRGLVAAALEPGDRVVVATPLCLGCSPADALWFIQQVHARGASVVVYDKGAVIEPGDDVDGLLEDIGRACNTLYQRRWREKRRAAK